MERSPTALQCAGNVDGSSTNWQIINLIFNKAGLFSISTAFLAVSAPMAISIHLITIQRDMFVEGEAFGVV